MIALFIWFSVFILLACFVTVAVIVGWALLAPTRHCPGCNQPLPRMRKPTSREEALGGGWTCAHCGTRCDRHARRIGPPLAAPAAGDAAARYEQIGRLKALLDAGALSQAEFDREKQGLLADPPPGARPPGSPA